MMKYSDELIKKIKEFYLNEKEVLESAKSGNVMLGRYLDELRSYFPYEFAYKMLGKDGKFDEKRFKTFVNFVEKEHEKFELYNMWTDEMEKFRDAHPNDLNTAKMVYSDDLRVGVINMYPEDKTVMHLLNENNCSLGRFLDEYSSSAYESIYKLLQNKTKTAEEKFEEIMNKAENAEKSNEIYTLWTKEAEQKENVEEETK